MPKAAGIETVGIVGCGQMGAGIAQVVAESGYAVVVREVNDDRLRAGLEAVEKGLARSATKRKAAAAEREAARARVRGVTDLAELRGADLVIEAIVEDLAAKASLFSALHRIAPERAILATNTSSLNVTELAAASGRPDRVVGLHFFNPAAVLPLVEAIRAVQTSDEAFRRSREFAASLGKTVVSAPDTPGFIVNRLLVPYLLDAIRALEAGVGSRDDIDEAMRLGCGHPMGPLTLLDFVGLDTSLAIAEIMFREFKDPRFAAPPLLKRLVLAGRIGKKSGHGFYEWGADGKKAG
ncbi:MAG: 3-hydroxyacyl-CoA dehydrogenase NAD-binding domain-containing protein [Planctomycetales bacterium]|nr:3-hydroxyacyl-CoA dehydrogenase NAD-binding domain-containing protein [Planctomycetales bacterium]